MSTSDDNFTLRVTFTGLGVHVIHRTLDRVAVLLPEARLPADATPESEPVPHVDGTIGVPHVGYLRIDVANLVAPELAALLPAGNVEPDGYGVPGCEALYQLDRQSLDFGLPTDDGPRQTPPDQLEVHLPDLKLFAPRLELIDGLFDARPAAPELLFRTILHGGTYRSSVPKEKWRLAGTLMEDHDRCAYEFKLSGYTNWSIELPGDGVTLTLRKFDGSEVLQIPLCAVRRGGERVVHLKIANLCADNPLEWDRLGIRQVPEEDVDFKWHYRLFRPKDHGKSWDELLAGAMLPAPRFVSGRAFGAGDDCGAKRMTLDDFPSWETPVAARRATA